MQPRAKAAVIASLKQAETTSLAEQNNYRPIIKAAFATPATEKHEQLLEELDEDGLERLMAGECFPPTGQDWKRIKGYEWDQIPRCRQLGQVEDRDISFWLYMLGEVTDHTKRIKATARFFGYFGAINDNILNTFIYWQQVSILNRMIEVDNLTSPR